jgi:hypothetical protein
MTNVFNPIKEAQLMDMWDNQEIQALQNELLQFVSEEKNKKMFEEILAEYAVLIQDTTVDLKP